MTEKTMEPKVEAVPDLDDLLQCPVCYEIPAGQIFQCNEGHHVCGRCKLRLDVCPVCRAFFFGTRNYAMEELISNIRQLRAFKLGGKVTTGNTTPEQQGVEARESTSEDNNSTNNDDDSSVGITNILEAPRPCRGLFRCLCCKSNPERLPSARLLNHLRYFHSPQLIEGRSEENGEYLQAWQFATKQDRIVTAVRVGEMGLFFLVIEITRDSVFAWLSMAASPVVAQEFSYTFTLSGNDREAIFSDCVWSVRTCEGYLKKRSRCLSVTGADARALLSPTTMSAKLALHRTPPGALPQAQPRAVLRVANRSNRSATTENVPQELEPFLQDLQNDVARLSRAFATLGREANALVRSEVQMRARLESRRASRSDPAEAAPEPPVAPPAPIEAAPSPEPEDEPAPETAPLSRNARRRMRQRLRKALREIQMSGDVAPSLPHAASQPAPSTARQTNGEMDYIQNNSRVHNAAAGSATNQNSNTASANNSNRAITNQSELARASMRAGSPFRTMFSSLAIIVEPPQPAPPMPPPTAADGNGAGGRNKKKRRQRR